MHAQQQQRRKLLQDKRAARQRASDADAQRHAGMGGTLTNHILLEESERAGRGFIAGLCRCWS